jgi:hypothetical protein
LQFLELNTSKGKAVFINFYEGIFQLQLPVLAYRKQQLKEPSPENSN